MRDELGLGMVMFKSVFAALVLAGGFGAGLSGQAVAGNLVQNGSFDNVGSVFVNNTGLGSDDSRTSGATNIPSWSNVAGFSNEFWAETPNDYGLTQSPGNASTYWVDLTGQANDKPYGGIEQTIITTPGQNYVLTFDLGSSTLYNGSDLTAAALTASAAGASQLFTLTPTGTNDWKSETLAFKAIGATTTIEFLASSDYTSRYTGLDNVSVTSAVLAAPEPGVWALMLAGLAMMGGALRLRRRQAGVIAL